MDQARTTIVAHDHTRLEQIRIGQKFNLAEQTVRNHISHLYSAIGVASRGEAVVWAQQHGFG